MDRITAMTAFVTVAELRGFAPAARRLGFSASTTTRLVAGLEEHLSIRLLQRTTRSVTLTDAGARYLERARRIVTEIDEAERAARAERSDPTGRFTVAAPSVFGRLHVGPVMCELLRRHPTMTGELTLSDRNANLVEDGIDAAVRIGVPDDSSLVARRVGTTRRVVVGSPKYLRGKRPRTPADLASHATIQFVGLSPVPIWRFRDEVVSITPRLATNSVDAAIDHAERGGGLAMVLAYQIIEAVRAKRLEVVLADYEPSPLPILVVHPTKRLVSANVRAFVDLIVETSSWQFVDLAA